MASSELKSLHARNMRCEACPRLRKHCLKMAREKRRSYADQTYWGRPITGFGDPAARLMIVGLAPAAHGANRTGRIFTGDRSGDWLYRALYRAGFANQAESVSASDGLQLKDAYVTCVVKCAPPDNKPSPAEIARCAGFLEEELRILSRTEVWVALGQIAYHTLWRLRGHWPFFKAELNKGARPPFAHGAKIHLGQSDLGKDRWLLLSYHPSQQNTFTGRLTEPMFDSVFDEAKRLIGT